MKKLLSIISLFLLLLITGCGNISLPGGNNGGNTEEPECVHSFDEKYIYDETNH